MTSEDARNLQEMETIANALSFNYMQELTLEDSQLTKVNLYKQNELEKRLDYSKNDYTVQEIQIHGPDAQIRRMNPILNCVKNEVQVSQKACTLNPSSNPSDREDYRNIIDYCIVPSSFGYDNIEKRYVSEDSKCAKEAVPMFRGLKKCVSEHDAYITEMINFLDSRIKPAASGLDQAIKSQLGSVDNVKSVFTLTSNFLNSIELETVDKTQISVGNTEGGAAGKGTAETSSTATTNPAVDPMAQSILIKTSNLASDCAIARKRFYSAIGAWCFGFCWYFAIQAYLALLISNSFSVLVIFSVLRVLHLLLDKNHADLMEIKKQRQLKIEAITMPDLILKSRAVKAGKVEGGLQGMRLVRGAPNTVERSQNLKVVSRIQQKGVIDGVGGEAINRKRDGSYASNRGTGRRSGSKRGGRSRRR